MPTAPLPAGVDDGKWLGLSREKDRTGDPDRYMREDIAEYGN